LENVVSTTHPNLSQDRMLQAIRMLPHVKAERCRRSFSHFAKEFWSEQSNDTLKWNWHMDYICEELSKMAHRVARFEANKYDLIINVPPGTSKTSLSMILFPIWCWVNYPWLKFIAVSYASDLSLESAEKSRDILTSEKFKKLFPHIILKRDKSGKSNFMIQEHTWNKYGKYVGLKNGGNRFSTSVGAKVTGFHAHIILIDDPLNPQQSTSKVELDKANMWLTNTLANREVEKGITTRIMIMQRVHQNDPTGFSLKKAEEDTKYKLKHICLPGEIRTPKYKSLVNPPELIHRYTDGLLDTVRMSYDVLMGLKARMGQYGFAGQVGQSPTPPGGNMFKTDNILLIDHIPVDWEIEKIVRFWDKASTKDAGCFTAGVKMARIRKRKEIKFVIMDVCRGQWASEVREKRIKDIAHIDGVRTIIWHEQEPGAGGKESAEATNKNLLGFAAYYEKPKGDKIYRADPFSVAVNDGFVWMLKGPWNKEFIEEYEFFPNSTYKDQVDAGGAAFAKLTMLKRAGVM